MSGSCQDRWLSAALGRAPFGAWADRLSSHVGKHGAEVGCSTEPEYVAAANAVVANDAALHKEEADGDDIYYLEETGELVVVSTKGYIRTYFISDLDYFGRQ